MHSHLEFLGQFSTEFETNKLFQSLLRLVEVQDIVTQFAHLRSKPLIGYSDLPQSVIAAVSTHFRTVPGLALTAKALDDGFPLLIKPITEYQHSKRYITLNTLVTVPRIASDDSFCTIESLLPLQYRVGDKCYTGPLVHNDLVLVSCLNSKLVVRADTLIACFSQTNALICPETILKSSNDSTWLGFPWTPGTKMTFERTHVEVTCDENLPSIYHLGGRYYMSTTTTTLQLSTGPLAMTPLSIYHIPCNETNPILKTGFGFCPSTVMMSIPIFQKISVNYIPWTPPTDNEVFKLHYKSLKISPLLKFNKTTINALDNAFLRLDGRLHLQLKKIKSDIDSIHETQESSAALIIGSTALALSGVNTIILITISCCYYKIHKQKMKQQHSDTQQPRDTVKYVPSQEDVQLPLNEDHCLDCEQPLGLYEPITQVPATTERQEERLQPKN